MSSIPPYAALGAVRFGSITRQDLKPGTTLQYAPGGEPQALFLKLKEGPRLPVSVSKMGPADVAQISVPARIFADAQGTRPMPGKKAPMFFMNGICGDYNVVSKAE